MLRRAFLGTVVLFGLSVWAWCRADHPQAEAATAGIADAADRAESSHDEAMHRYRTSQARHWRHVVIGGR